jgi:FkbM family methyltransferase
MWHRINHGLWVLHRLISTFGVRGLWMFCRLYVGREGKVGKVILPTGHRLFIRRWTSDAIVFRQMFVEREWDFTPFPQSVLVMNKYRDILDRGRKPVIIDCGANTGLSSVFLAQLFPKAVVVSIEPSDDNFKILSQNVGLFPSITPIRCGVWDRPTHLKIINPTARPCSYETGECDPADPDAIPAVPIPDVMEKVPDGEPLIIKMDVEGAEEAIFRSNTSWVGRTPLIMIELHDYVFPQRRTSSNFIACIANMRFEILVLGGNIFIFNWDGLTEMDHAQTGQQPCSAG